MRLRHALSILALCLRLSVRNAFVDSILMFGWIVIYAALIILYAGIIRLIPDADIAPFGFTHAQMIWYVGTAEYIVFCGSDWWYKELQNDIRDDRFNMTLLRPVPSAVPRMGLWLGEAIVAAVFMFLPYVGLLYALTGTLPGVGPLLGVVASVPLACLIMVCGSFLIGASCYWFIQAEPAFWVWQKCIFLLGAMLWPMAFFPSWAQTFMWLTPFPGILTKASNWVLTDSLSFHALGYLHQSLWALAFLVLLWRYDKMILRHVQRTGA